MISKAMEMTSPARIAFNIILSISDFLGFVERSIKALTKPAEIVQVIFYVPWLAAVHNFDFKIRVWWIRTDPGHKKWLVPRFIVAALSYPFCFIMFMLFLRGKMEEKRKEKLQRHE